MKSPIVLFKKNPISFSVKALVFVIFLLYAISLIYPFVWMAYNSLKTSFEFFENVFSWPSSPQWSNWSDAFVNFRVEVPGGQQVNMLRMFVTSILLVSAATLLEVFLSALAAYAVCFYKFPGRRMFYQ